MKKLLCLMLLFSLAATMYACKKVTVYQEPVNFYYMRSEIAYGQADGVIAAQQAEAVTHTGDLPYLLKRYLLGPTEEGLLSPFPENIALVSVKQHGTRLTVTLNSALGKLTGLPLTVACACLTKTCLNLTDAEQVEICAKDGLLDGAKSIIMDESCLILLAGIPQATTA